MPKNIYYDDIKIIKKPFKSRIKLIFKIFMFCLTIIGCFFSAKYFSKALTIGNVTSFILYGDTILKIPKKSMYAVTMGSYDTFDGGESVGLGLMTQGGSGFVWEDNKYYVIGSIYNDKQSAESVMNNLNESNYTLQMLEIKFPAINIRFEDYENKDVKEIENAFKLIDMIINEIYTYSIKFDKSEMNNFAVSSAISGLRGEVKSTISTLQNILSKDNEKLRIIQSYYIKLDGLLDSAILQTIECSNNYLLKNINSQIIRLKFDLYNSL